LDANPVAGRLTLDVGAALGLKDGDNPHRWYDPADVEAIARTITADLVKLDAKDAPQYRRLLARFEDTGLSRYRALIAAIAARYAGVPVGASESIFAPQAQALGLSLVTPASFMKAISEGTDVTAQDLATVERQIDTRAIKVWIYNSQNATPEVQQLGAMARARGIPIATVTETLSPAGATFQQWQVTQLEQIREALRRATGR
jgi:zinc/manganese transport system substrate-binding protein